MEGELADTKTGAASCSGPAEAALATDEVRGWIETFLAGGAASEEAFARIVTRYRDRVVSVVTAMLGEADPAEDVAQEVFLKVHLNLSRFRFE